jgi:topoisomerase-4 subunit A
MKLVKHDLKNLTAYAIKWFETLQEKYGKGLKRRTQYDEIEQISAAEVVSANQRLYVNREEGFIGLNWRQHEFVQECTILDDVLCIMADGSMKVARVGDKVFMGPRHHPLRGPSEGRRHRLLHDGLSGQGEREGLREEVPDRRRDPRQALPARQVDGSRVVYFEVKQEREGDRADPAHRARRPQPRAGARSSTLTSAACR